jgi:hypothetical protein
MKCKRNRNLASDNAILEAISRGLLLGEESLAMTFEQFAVSGLFPVGTKNLWRSLPPGNAILLG